MDDRQQTPSFTLEEDSNGIGGKSGIEVVELLFGGYGACALTSAIALR